MFTTESLEASAVDIWLIRMPSGYLIDARHLAWLDDAERDQAASFYDPSDRDLYIAAHVWLRKVLGATLTVRPGDLAFVRDEYGKPSLAGATPRPINFSLSHTHGGIACALSGVCEVGADIERVVPISNLGAIAAHTLHPYELRTFQAKPAGERLHRFYRFWAAKESLLKAVGTGLDVEPRRVAFVESPEGDWQLVDYPRDRIGEMGSVTYVGDIAAEAGFSQFDYVVALSALAPASTLTIRNIRCGASTADARSEDCRTFHSVLGAAQHA